MATEPTNSDIIREMRSVTTRLEDHEERIKPLERWKIAYDAANEALTQYRQENPRTYKSGTSLNGVNRDFVTLVFKMLAFFSGVIAIIYLLIDRLVH